MRTKRWAGLAGVMMLMGPLLLAARATAGDGETCVNASDGVAIAACTQAIRSGRYSGHGLAVLYANRCAAHFNKGETDLALSDCNQAIQLDPKNAMAFHNRAAGYSAKGDYDRAIGDLDQVIQLDPKNAKAFNNRGFGYAAKGDYDRAIGDYDQAIQLDPKNAISYASRWRRISRRARPIKH
jgi:tetratricopeptide (TPR) repeat protein